MKNGNLNNEVGHNGFNCCSFGLLNNKHSFVSNQQTPLLQRDFRLPTKAYPAHTCCTATWGYLGSPLVTYFFMRLKQK